MTSVSSVAIETSTHSCHRGHRDRRGNLCDGALPNPIHLPAQCGKVSMFPNIWDHSGRIVVREAMGMTLERGFSAYGDGYVEDLLLF